MTAKEKAVRLVDRYLDEVFNKTDVNFPLELPIRLATIAVNLHLEELSKMKLIFSDREIHYKYWQEVKQEIELL
jgi:hypothetical protein